MTKRRRYKPDSVFVCIRCRMMLYVPSMAHVGPEDGSWDFCASCVERCFQCTKRYLHMTYGEHRGGDMTERLLAWYADRYLSA